MAISVDVTPEMIEWAAERSGKDREALVRRFPRLPEWQAGSAPITYAQLEDFAGATYTPIGYFFLDTPPSLAIPIADYRARNGTTPSEPTPALLETVAIARQQQDWYRAYALREQFPAVHFVGSLSQEQAVDICANKVRAMLNLDATVQAGIVSPHEALRNLIDRAEAAGILVMVSGIVGTNTHRSLRDEDFSGFALSDPLAPLVFINGTDAKARQVFTLAHELVHIGLGESVLSNATVSSKRLGRLERWCNAVAAETLAPSLELKRDFQSRQPIGDEVKRLARKYGVSQFVILRRLFDIEAINETTYRSLYTEKLQEGAHAKQSDDTGGGDYYNNQFMRLGKRFTTSVLESTLSGETLYSEAYRLLGSKKSSVLGEMAQRLGMA